MKILITSFSWHTLVAKGALVVKNLTQSGPDSISIFSFGGSS